MLAFSMAIGLLGAQAAVGPHVLHKACKFWRVFEAVSHSDAQAGLVERVVYTIFFAESVSPKAPHVRPTAPS